MPTVDPPIEVRPPGRKLSPLDAGRRHNPDLRPTYRVIEALGVVVGYIVLGKLGFLFAATPYGASPVWPAAGFASWVVLQRGQRVVPWIGVATLILMRSVATPWSVAIAVSVGNALNPYVGWRLRAWVAGDIKNRLPSWEGLPFSATFSHFRAPAFLRFVGAGALVPSIVSAGLGVLGFGPINPVGGSLFLTWFLGDALGVFLVGGGLLALSGMLLSQRRERIGARKVEAFSHLVISAVVGLFCFSDAFLKFERATQTKYLMLPVLAWAAIRLPVVSNWLLSFLLGLFIPVFLVDLNRRGVLPDLELTFQIENLQGYLGVTCGTGLLLSYIASSLRDSLEAERAARKLAEEAVAARDEFLSIAAHELRTPLTPIVLQAQLMEKLLGTMRDGIMPASGVMGALSKGVGLSLEQLRKLVRLVDELLDPTRLSRTGLKLDLEECNLSQLVERVVQQQGAPLEAAGCRLSVHLEAGVLIRGDPLRLERVLENMIFNWIRYAPRSEVSLTLELDAQSGVARLDFRDHGPGIADSDRVRLFGKYQRLHSSASYGGLGIGLFLSKQIIEGHGGQMTLETLPRGEAGALFRVSLPLLHAARAAAA